MWQLTWYVASSSGKKYQPSLKDIARILGQVGKHGESMLLQDYGESYLSLQAVGAGLLRHRFNLYYSTGELDHKGRLVEYSCLDPTLTFDDIVRIFSLFLKNDSRWFSDYSWDGPLELENAPVEDAAELRDDPQQKDRSGVIYLLKAGEWYKIGKTTDPKGRMRQLDIQLPEKPVKVHEIHTNNIHRLEKHWHRFFAAKRANGEWFQLSEADVIEFTSYGVIDLLE